MTTMTMTRHGSNTTTRLLPAAVDPSANVIGGIQHDNGSGGGGGGGLSDPVMIPCACSARGTQWTDSPSCSRLTTDRGSSRSVDQG